MTDTELEVLRFVQENDVKFIRLAFSDMFGIQKNISVMPDELPRAFETGISFDASAVRGFLNVEQSDLFITPDPSTLSILPWRPSHGRVVRLFCNVNYPDGRPFEGSSRHILQRAVKEAAQMGYVCKIGAECEFYLFETDEKGNPTMNPHDLGGYCDIAPNDKGENVRREICLTLEEMGIHPETSHHEQGPGQNEIDFKYSDAMTAADNLLTFKAAVKSIAARNGLYASFMPKPLPDKSGSGLHVNLSLSQGGRNIFKTAPDEGHCPEAEHFMAGVLDHIREITVFLNPLTNSYARFGAFEAPRYLSWSHQNRSQLIRIPAATGAQSRMELRSPDPSCNPHLAFAMLLQAGLDGIRRELPLCPAVDLNLYDAEPGVLEKMPALPENLEEAVLLARRSAFVQRVLPAKTLANYCDVKLEDWKLTGARQTQSYEKRKPGEGMERVLVVSGSERGREFLRELLRGQEYGQGFFADNSGEARRKMAEDDFSLVVINAPLRDESGEQLALWAAQSTDAGVLLLVKAEIADEVSARVEDSGAMVLPKPISRQFFCQSLKFVSAARRRMRGLKNENTRLQKKIDDIRLVDRAKCVLIQYADFTEQQAHRYIEKKAMDQRVSRREVAEDILRIYES